MTIKCLALRYKAVTKSSLKDALKWAQDHYYRYLKYEGRCWFKCRKESNSPYLEKEFIFRGYVPLRSFKKEAGYNYIQSNTLINGKRYIYPQKCCRRWDIPDHNKWPNPYIFMAEVGIPGYTEVDVNYKL